MHTHGWSSEYYEIEYADWDAISSYYGDWEYDGRRRRESSDATSWSTLTSAPISARPFASSTWSQGSTLMPVALHNNVGDPHLYRWSRSTNSSIGARIIPLGDNSGKLELPYLTDTDISSLSLVSSKQM